MGQFDLADTQRDGKWVLTCPNCGREFPVQYRNDRTYCDCKLPYELQPVMAKDKPLTNAGGTTILETMETTMLCSRCHKPFVIKIKDQATAEVLLDAFETTHEPLESLCPECQKIIQVVEDNSNAISDEDIKKFAAEVSKIHRDGR